MARFGTSKIGVLVISATVLIAPYAVALQVDALSTLDVSQPLEGSEAYRFCPKVNHGSCSTYTFSRLSEIQKTDIGATALVLKTCLQTGASFEIGSGDLASFESAANKCGKFSPYGSEFLRIAKQILTRFHLDNKQCLLQRRHAVGPLLDFMKEPE